MGRLLVPAESLITHIDNAAEEASQRRFMEMSVVRYVSIGGAVFMCYMIPHLSVIYSGLGGAY
jgi:hypothetical protein